MNLICTMAVGDFYRQLAEITFPFLKYHADKIGADCKIIDDLGPYTDCPWFGKFKIYDFLADYDRVMFVDVDAIVRPDCPDLFEIVPEDHYGACDEAAYWGIDMQVQKMMKLAEMFGISMDPSRIHHSYNSGTIVVGRVHRPLFVKPEPLVPWKEIVYDLMPEQNYLNLLLVRDRVPVHTLPIRFNRMGFYEFEISFLRDFHDVSYIQHSISKKNRIGHLRQLADKWRLEFRHGTNCKLPHKLL